MHFFRVEVAAAVFVAKKGIVVPVVDADIIGEKYRIEFGSFRYVGQFGVMRKIEVARVVCLRVAPGGDMVPRFHQESAQFHTARITCRRCARNVFHLSDKKRRC